MGLLTAVSLGVAQLFALSTRANLIAKGQTSTTAMAEQKLEQLRGLTWGFDTERAGAAGQRHHDQPRGRSADGRRLGAESLAVRFARPEHAPATWTSSTRTARRSAPARRRRHGGRYIRRWSIQPLPTNPNNTLVLQVLVTPVANEAVARRRPAVRAAHAGRRAARDRQDEEGTVSVAPLPHRKRGFTLTELLISTAIMLTVTGAIFGLMNPAQGSGAGAAGSRRHAAADARRQRDALQGAGHGRRRPVPGGDDRLAGQLLRADPAAAHRPASAPIRRRGPASFKTDAITLSYIPNSYSQTTISAGDAAAVGGAEGDRAAELSRRDASCAASKIGMQVIIFDTTGNFDMFIITQRPGLRRPPAAPAAGPELPVRRRARRSPRSSATPTT